MVHRLAATNGDTNSYYTHRCSRRPGHFGVDRTTHKNLQIVHADLECNVLLVRGPVPGRKNALVLVSTVVWPPKDPAPAKAAK